MATDLLKNSDGLLEVDQFGDYATVSGDANVKQQIELAVGRGLTDIQMKPLTQKRKRKVRQTIKTALESIEYVDTIVAVTLQTLDDETLKVDVQTQSDDLQFTV